MRKHVNEDGIIGDCEAAPGNCPVSKSEADHGETVAEVRAKYELRMKSQEFPDIKLDKDGRPTKATMNKLSKTTDDRNIIHAVLAFGTERSLQNLAQNPHVTSGDLSTAFHRAETSDAKKALVEHESFPVSEMPDQDFVRLARLRKIGFLQDHQIGDRHVQALIDDPGHRTDVFLRTTLSNSRNRVTAEFLNDAVRKGDVRVTEVLGNEKLDPGLISSEFFNTRTFIAYERIHPQNIDAVIDLAVKQGNANSLYQFARNERINSAQLDRVVQLIPNPEALEHHPNLSGFAKNWIAEQKNI